MFDKNGRRIPMNFQGNVCDPDKNFKLVQPSMQTVDSYDYRLFLISKYLGVDLGITAEEFKTKTEEILSRIPSDSVNIKNGTWLPLVLPKFEGDDIGFFLENLLGCVNESYKKTFDRGRWERYFCKYRGVFANQVKSACHTQDELIEKMKEGPIVIVFFPNALQGFSIKAAREQIGSLPIGFIQSGIETIVAMIMYSDVLMKDYQTPGLLLSAFSWQSAKYSFGFKARDFSLRLYKTDFLSGAYGNYSAGLSFRG